MQDSETASGESDTIDSRSGPLQRRSFLRLAGLAATSTALPAFPLEGRPAHARPGIDARTIPNVYVNQVGYLPAQQKIATLVLGTEARRDHTDAHFGSSETLHTEPGSTFQVVSADTGQIAFSAPLSSPFFDPLADDQVCLADFSALRRPGRYRLSALRRTSDIFTVAENVYANPLRLAMRAFYGQRCGCEVDLGGGYKHPPCHLKAEFSPSSGRAGPCKNSGGWHDAGDYGRYIVNSGITCGTLLLAWEMYPASLHALHLDLPESGRGIPDFLAEVKWNLDWMLTLQDPEDAGVWHKQTSTHFCAFVMPEQDDLPSEIIGTGTAPYKSTCATADFAAVMAVAARCYKPFDADFAAHCLSAARLAFAWSQAHPDIPFRNPIGVTTGEYGEPHCGDEALWAAAELFRTTREPAFEQAFLARVTPGLDALRIGPPSWANVTPLALWSYVLACGAGASTSPVCRAIRNATQAAAEELIQRKSQSAYGTTLEQRDFRWGSNSAAANQSLLLLLAYRLQPHPETLSAALSNLHYLLGRNCFGVSWVTQVGTRPLQHPHHRPSVADGLAAPWPGLLSGGPNAGGGDALANHLAPSAPMRMWLDDDRAYSLNEVAINWNAPLVFLLAAANDSRRG